MSDATSELTPAQEETPPPEPQTQEPEQHAAPPPADDDALEPELQAQVIDIPTGEKLVPLSALTSTRRELKTVKGQVQKVTELEQQLQEAQGKLAQANPVLQAAQALLAAQQQARNQPQAPQQPSGPSPQELADLEAYARDLDLYDQQGKPDVDRARRIRERTLKDAEAIAQRVTEPLVEHRLTQDARYMMERAKVTAPDGIKPEETIFNTLVQRVSQQPGGMRMLANEEYMKHLWVQALGLTALAEKQGKKTQQAVQREPLPPPIINEKSGGQSGASYTLNAGDKRLAKDLGMTEAEFAKEVANIPWGKK